MIRTCALVVTLLQISGCGLVLDPLPAQPPGDAPGPVPSDASVGVTCPTVCGDVAGGPELTGEDVRALSTIDSSPCWAHDIDGNGLFEPEDVEMLRNHVAGAAEEICPCPDTCGDFNDDGRTDTRDVMEAEWIQGDPESRRCDRAAGDLDGDGEFSSDEVRQIRESVVDGAGLDCAYQPTEEI